MDKSAIRNFAIEARKMLMKSAETEAGFYGVTKKGCDSPIQKGNDFEVYKTIAGTENRIYGTDIKRRANLVKAVETLGFEQVIEETAYTWFNRIIAIRFMEVNDYLPTRVRVLSSETGSNTPDIVTQSLDVDLNMTPEELKKVQKAKDENRYDDAFRMLFIKQCNELNAILPGLFEKTDDYMELLLKLSYTSDGVVRMLVDSIDENNFNVETEGQVEIIGWMYQYYNTELKAEVFGRPSGTKIKKEDIPAATQLFTPDWIVRYMVENSVGRVWIEHLRVVDSSVDDKAKAEEFGWKYYLPEAEQEEEANQKLVEIREEYLTLEPKDITCIDPCMGSGHILVYMFDILMDIYRSEGFGERDAVFSILENNIHGLDIDKRAYQLSYFALMMKARGYNRTFFRGKQDGDGLRTAVTPIVFAIDESNDINWNQLKYFGADLSEIEKNNAMNQMLGLLDTFKDAREYGAILNVDDYDWNLLKRFVSTEKTDGQISFDTFGISDTQKKLFLLIEQGRVMAKKYWVVSTNPPYMGVSNGGGKLNDYVKKEYPNSKTDLYSVFIEKCGNMLHKYGFQSMITMQGWMFLSSFEKTRSMLFEKQIINLLKIGYNSFPEMNSQVAHACAFIVINGRITEYLARYFDLNTGKVTDDKNKVFLHKKSEDLYVGRKNRDFEFIPGMPLAFSLSKKILDAFRNDKLVDLAKPRQGLATGENDRFLRLWFECNSKSVSYDSCSIDDAIKSNAKWFPYNKGGDFRKWYGNNDYVVNWSNDGYEIKHFYNEKGKLRSRPQNTEAYFKESVTWSKISTDTLAFRYKPYGHIFDVAGTSFFAEHEVLLYLHGLANSVVAMKILKSIAPTLNFEVGHIASLPIIMNEFFKDEIIKLVNECISISKQDWDAFETSWDFVKHPLIRGEGLIRDAYNEWKKECDDRFLQLKNNENRLNEVFISIYGLEDELSAEVEDKYVTVHKADKKREIKSLLSYAVGCIMGRYSLSKDGLIYADINGCINEEDYNLLLPDSDGILLISDQKYFDDDIVEQIVQWISTVFGEKYLEENLKFIAETLGSNSVTAKDCIREYFINDFYEDHINRYSVKGSGKRPIYWLFDSGKQNGFKCLIYMHRYNKDTLNLIRSEYLHKTEDAVENALKNAEYIIQTSASAVERAKATKDRDRYVKQLNEMRIYYQALSHLALQKIEIDLDDGVKHNYQLFQGIEVIADGGKKQKVDLLAKI